MMRNETLTILLVITVALAASCIVRGQSAPAPSLSVGKLNSLAIGGHPIPVKALWAKRVHPPKKAATIQMESSRASVIAQPVTIFPLSFIAVPVDTNKTIWLQSSSEMDDASLPMTNVIGYIRNGALVEQNFSSTTPKRFFRLYLP